MSYLWYPIFGSLITFTSGVIISYFTGFTDLSQLNEMLITPPLRKFLSMKRFSGVKTDVPEAVKMLDTEVCTL